MFFKQKMQQDQERKIADNKEEKLQINLSRY